ncbi:hypothetical protein BGZ99_010112 [Dissophora globulifera]|uniref:Uncharacterized protein n=1 Tax=Dissophora globulifera TaxID=979702 RepID=A0A9P6R6X2_9FUNG|nr:hypothetical protein BGZ99_010112 [Dissophora globulifera]
MPSKGSPTLLPECLGHVLSFLQFNQVPTLCSLLLVNKTLFQLTLPILYQNPFLLVRSHRLWSEEEKAERLVSLLRLFLSEVDPVLLAELPDYSTTDDPDDQGQEPSQQHTSVALVPKSYSAENGGYFHHYRRHDHSFLAARAIPRLFGATTKAQSRIILAQLDLIFLTHCGSRTLSVCLASVRVKQFERFIPTLSCLRRLEVHHLSHINETTLQALVDWIKSHDNAHGTLRELQIGGLTEYDDYEINNTPDLVRLPQSFTTLCALDTRSWSEAWSMIDQVPLESLDRLVMDYGEGHVLKGESRFLLRCRSLKVLDLFIPAPDIFQAIAQLFMARNGNYEATSTGQGLQIPPVERLYISGDHINLRNALDDAGVGLSQSLKVLKATSMARYSVQRPSLVWGQPLPFLQDLQLYGDIALEFPFELLKCCPNLVSLKLMVNGMESCGQADNPIDEILSLRKLQTLQLLGRWPLSNTFIRGIAANLTGLKILDLARCHGVCLNDAMEAVWQMEYLWRLGWDLEEEGGAEALLGYWHQRAPKVRVGPIHWDEFLL